MDRAGGVCGKQPTDSDLALIGVEIVFSLRLAIGNAADPTAIAPGSAVVITKEAEDPIPLQRPMAAHDEPTFPWLPLFLWERKLGVTEGGAEGGSEAGKGNPPPPKWEGAYGPLQFCACLLRVRWRSRR